MPRRNTSLDLPDVMSGVIEKHDARRENVRDYLTDFRKRAKAEGRKRRETTPLTDEQWVKVKDYIKTLQ